MIPTSEAELRAWGLFRAGAPLERIAAALFGEIDRADLAAALDLADEFLDAIDFDGAPLDQARSESARKREPRPRRIPTCGHPDRRHASKGRCGTCYERERGARRRRASTSIALG